MKKSYFSGSTMADLRYRFPHVSEWDFNFLLNHHIYHDETVNLRAEGNIIATIPKAILKISEAAAKDYGLPMEIELYSKDNTFLHIDCGDERIPFREVSD
ncbi:hypothetical protein [Gracilibacillus alcaliphilus]|uniref:hypothetical protein n=1 Tax=Gracilibacillus alcaliphilus TaxID=1401441 RepID=UPI001956FEA2|nr:hypothetical protein [Gracilibacillus alcaliphilus]MBM7678393.1 hypothetical protein [Gracilibacillus alcaliphilus]